MQNSSCGNPLMRLAWKKNTIAWVAAATVSIGGAVAVWLLSGGRGEAVSEPAEAVPKARRVAKAIPQHSAAQAAAPEKTNAPAPAPRRVEFGREVVSSSVRTNANGAVIEKLVLADGTTASKINPPPPVFKNAAEQVIALAISTPLGKTMPPLPDLSGIDADFEKSLLEPTEIDSDDSEEVKEMKRQVAEVKAELAERVRNGESLMEILATHQAEMNRVADARLAAIRRMQQIAAEDGLDAAQRYAQDINESFEEEGIPAIPVIGSNRGEQ